MKRWVTVSRIGTGLSPADARRPDLKGVAGILGYVVAADDGNEMLVKVIKDRPALDELRWREGVRYHGDEPLGVAARAAIVEEGTRYSVAGADWQPEGYDVAE